MTQMIDKDKEKMRDLESQFRKSKNYKLELKRDDIIKNLLNIIILVLEKEFVISNKKSIHY